MQWKAYGDEGMTARAEACFDMANYLKDRLQETPGFRLLIDEPECTNICFWYIPTFLRGQKEDSKWWAKVALVSKMFFFMIFFSTLS